MIKLHHIPYRFFSKIGLAALLSCTVLTATHGQYVDLLWGRLAHYPLNRSAEDISGNEIHGTLSGTLPAAGREGKEGHALSFDGEEDFIRCGNRFPSIGPAVAVSCWIRTGDSEGYRHLVSKYDFAADAGFILGIKNDQVLWAGRTGSGQFTQLTSLTRVDDNEWHHLVGIIEGSSWSLYLDGKLENSLDTGLPGTDLSSDASLSMGRYESGDDGDHRNYRGIMDEVIIYDRPLNPCEIEVLYAGNKFRER